MQNIILYVSLHTPTTQTALTCRISIDLLVLQILHNSNGFEMQNINAYVSLHTPIS